MIHATERGLSLMEVLELRHLSEEGLLFEEGLDPTWVDAQLESPSEIAFSCESGSKARLEVTPLGPMENQPPILIRGHATAAVRSTCVRCLEDVVLHLSVDFEQTLFRKKTEQEAEPELDEPSDDGAYDEAGVDLPNVLREAILLELAMNPSCEDEPACDARTQALIDATNAKHSLHGDPRWAALQKLKDEQQQN